MKKKRSLTLMALAVMAVGAWAQEPTPTMTLTVKQYNTSSRVWEIFQSEAMTLNKDKENHWSKSLEISTTNTNLQFTATYNDGAGGDEKTSGISYFKVSSPTTVTFYARYGTFKNKAGSDENATIASCDAMIINIVDAKWKALGTIGSTNLSTIYNQYGASLKLLDNTLDKKDTYYLNYKNQHKGIGYKVNDVDRIPYNGECPGFTSNRVYRATLNYEECQITFETLNSYPLTISDAGAATLVLPYQVTLPSGLSAYTLTSDGPTTLTATKIAGGVIPAMTPVLINGPENNYDLVFQGDVVAYPEVDYSGNKFIKDVEPEDATNVLHGVLAPHYVRTEGYNYVLQNNKVNEEWKVGFYQIPGANNTCTYRINPFRAFINLTSLPSSGEARALTIVYDDDNTTGVKNVKNTLEEGSNEVYNLSGQRVGKDYKGVVIKNGRKMIQK